jgi:hypothetical protein
MFRYVEEDDISFFRFQKFKFGIVDSCLYLTMFLVNMCRILIIYLMRLLEFPSLMVG